MLLFSPSSGAMVSLIPTYLSEISPPHMRGRMVGLAAVGQVTGYVSTISPLSLFQFANASSSPPPDGLGTDAILETKTPRGVC
jgi:MFS family permease